MHAIAETRRSNSVLSLITANLVTIALALYEGWNLQELMLIYWAQSIIIGYYNVRRILDLRQFSTENFKMNDVRPPENERTKRSTAFFFAIHYGLFHVVYLMFLVAGDQKFEGSWLLLCACVVAFLLNHRHSYHYYRQQDQDRKPNIGTIMFFPYARVVPMHLTIIFGNAFGPPTSFGLVLFLGLKSAADVVMHTIEHASWRK